MQTKMQTHWENGKENMFLQASSLCKVMDFLVHYKGSSAHCGAEQTTSKQSKEADMLQGARFTA